ncbi:MAG TPA: acetylxylan esterase [Planctomycetaceae bacterium]
MPVLRLLVSTALLLGLMLSATAQEGGWRADPEVVRRLSGQRPGINYDEAKVPEYELPDPLRAADGSVVRTPEAWDKRRAEILELFRTQVYGRRPGRPEELTFEVVEEDRNAMDGAATLKRVEIVSRRQGREHRFELILFLPDVGSRPVPVFLLINNRGRENTDPTRTEKSRFWPAEEVVARGYGVAAIQNGELAPDDKERFLEGVLRLFEGDRTEREPDACAALAAWGWGASRAMDYFETDPRVDASKVAVLGHSRGGKTALWAGAEDERFALVISNDSGCGGAALSRRKYGETVERINANFPHWFCGNFKAYDGREEELPVDQHMLVALMAPRAVYVASADEDLWADPRGEFLSLAHASPVYALWGHDPIRPEDMPPLDRPLVAGPRGYHVRSGGHDLTPEDWRHYMDFADRLWRPGGGR